MSNFSDIWWTTFLFCTCLYNYNHTLRWRPNYFAKIKYLKKKKKKKSLTHYFLSIFLLTMQHSYTANFFPIVTSIKWSQNFFPDLTSFLKLITAVIFVMKQGFSFRFVNICFFFETRHYSGLDCRHQHNT